MGNGSYLKIQTYSNNGFGRYVMSVVLLLCYYYTFPVLKTPYGYTTYITLDDMVSVIFVLVSLNALLNRWKSLESKLFRMLWVAILLAIPSVIIGYLVHRNLFALKYGAWQFTQYFKIFLVFACACVLEVNEKRYRRILKIAWAGSIFVGVYAVLQYFGVIGFRGLAERFAESGPWRFGFDPSLTRAIGPLSVNYACIGNYMVIAVLISYMLMRISNPALKIIYQISIPFFVIVTILSTSRAGLMGIIMAILIYMVFTKARPGAIIGIILALFAISISFELSAELAGRFIPGKAGQTLREYSAGRLQGWGEIAGYLLSHAYKLPTGVGMGAFGSLYDSGYVNLYYAHSNLLHWLVECGILGLILPLRFLITLNKTFREFTRGEKFYREIGFGMSSLLFALLFVATTQENFVPSATMKSLPAYIAFIFGITVALYRDWLFSFNTESCSLGLDKFEWELVHE